MGDSADTAREQLQIRNGRKVPRPLPKPKPTPRPKPKPRPPKRTTPDVFRPAPRPAPRPAAAPPKPDLNDPQTQAYLRIIQRRPDLARNPGFVRRALPRDKYTGQGFIRNAVGATAQAVTSLPGKVENDARLFARSGRRQDILPSLKGGVVSAFPRASEAVADAKKRGLDRTNLGGIVGGGILDVVGDSVGPNAAQAVTGEGFSKAGLGVEAAGIIPFLRGPAAIRAGLKAGIAARSVKAGEEAANAAFNSSTPIRTAAGALRPRRVFKAGDLSVSIPAARSRTGRAVEDAADALRGETSTLRRAGSEYGRSHRAKVKVYQAPALAMKQTIRKLNEGEIMALRVIAEQAAPAARREFHAAQAQAAPDAQTAVFHLLHGDALAKAEKYVTEGVNEAGQKGIVFTDAASPRLREAYRILSEVSGPRREEFLHSLDLLHESQIAKRAQAPGQIIHGGVFKQNEQIIEEAMQSSPGRTAIVQTIRKQFPDQPDVANHLIDVIDAQARSTAQRSGDPMAVENFYSTTAVKRVKELTDANVGKLKGSVLLHDDQGSLFDMPKAPKVKAKAEPQVKVGDLQAKHQGDLPDAIDTTPIAQEFSARTDIPLPPELRDVAALDARIKDVYELVKAGADGRYWYDQAADISKQLADFYGGDYTPAQMAQVVAIFSQAADTVANMSFVREAIDQYRQHGKIYAGRFPERQSAEAEAVLNGQPWEGRKRSSFYANIIENVDPEEYARLAAENGWGANHPVTVDRWVTRWFTPGVDVPNQYYDAYEQIIQKMAAQLGWKPKEVQAAAWVAGKKLSLAERYPKWGIEQIDAAGKDAYEVGMGKYFGQDSLFEAGTVSPHAKRAANMAKRPDGGGTLKADLSPDDSKTGFFTSFGAHEQIIPAKKITGAQIQAYRDLHQEILRNDRNARVGIWHNPEDGNVYLDISKRFPTKKEAIEFARREGQVGVWDVRKGKSFKTGLTDEEANVIKRQRKDAVYGANSGLAPLVPGASATPGPETRYENLLGSIAEQRGWVKPGKKPRKDDLRYAEQILFEWADANPTHPLAEKVRALYEEAHPSGPDPETFFHRLNDEPLKGMPTTAKLGGQEIQVGPSPELRSLAEEYTASSGIGDPPPTDYVKVDEDRARRIAKWYDEAGDASDSPAVQRSYAAFAKETLDQYRLLVERGYRFEFYPEGADPYPLGPRQAIQDLTENKHMYVFPTDEGFGSGAQSASTHPLLQDSGLQWGGKPVTWNDLFRAVHDVFGHGKEGVGFRADGEENAWRSHMAMYSPEARPAMTAETRGQNSWVNYGPHGEKNRTASQADTVYADQKATLAPEWVVYDGSGVPRPEKPLPSARPAQPGTLAAWEQERGIRQYFDQLPTRDVEAEALDAIPVNPELAPGSTDMSQFEIALPPEAKLLTSVEARDMAPDPNYVYHGTDPVSAEQAFAERRLGLDKAKPYDQYGQEPRVWTAENPRLAASYADAKTYDRTGGERGMVIAIPRSALPEGTEVGGNAYGVSNRIYGGQTFSSPGDVYFNRFAGKILGAVEFDLTGANVYLSEKAGVETVLHEFAHIARRTMSPHEERMVASTMGAKPIRGADGKITGYSWDEAAEEKFVRAALHVLATGRGPKVIKSQLRHLSKELRADFYHRDLPDLPPHVAETIERLWSFDKVKGGRIIGAEDWIGQSNIVPVYLGYEYGLPRSSAAQAVGGYIRTAREAIFAGGKGRAIGGGPVDPKTKKVFTGSILTKGFFKNSADAAVEDLMIASRIKAAQEARQDFLQVASDIPTRHDDQAIKVDPGKTTNPRLKKVAEIMRGLDDGLKYDVKDLQDLDLQVALGISEDLFPAMIGEEQTAEVAARIIETMEPVDNIKWVPKAFLERTGLLAMPEGAGKISARIPGGPAQKIVSGFGIAFDTVNDLGRAMLTYFNPAYVPMNLAGNLTMNILHQGALAPVNLWRAVQMSYHLRAEQKVLVDNLMGRGLAGNVGFQLNSRAIQHGLAQIGHVMGLAVDLFPRRAAFIHEARKLGYTGEDLAKLLERTDPEAIKILDDITRPAVEAIVDFERAAPWEKTISRYILFYPWLRGATRYVARLAIDQPLVFASLVMLREYAEAQANEQLGQRPGYARNAYPISTESIGLKVPFTDVGVGLDTLLGAHGFTSADGNPYVIDITQLMPATTPVDIVHTIDDVLHGRTSFAENLSPILQALVVAASGVDTFTGEDVGKGVGTFADQLFTQSPLQSRLERINRDPATRADRNSRSPFPRSKTQEILRLFGGSPTPSPYQVSAGQQAAALDHGRKDIAAVYRLRRDAKQYGLTPPPPDVVDQLQWKVRADAATEGKPSAIDRLEALAEVFVNRFPDQARLLEDVKTIQSDAEADQVARELRRELYGGYTEYQHELDYAKKEQQG